VHSLRNRLFGLWGLSLIACIAVGLLLRQLYQQSTEAQVGRAEAVVARACDLIRDRYRFYATEWSGPLESQFDAKLRADLATVVGLALEHQDGVEGGIWSDAGPLGYSFPTQMHSTIADWGPDEPARFEPFGREDHPTAIPDEKLQTIRSLGTEDEDIAAIGVGFEGGGDQRRQAVDTLSEVEWLRGDQDLQVGTECDHARARTAAMTARASAGSTVPSSRT
jgi:hypothetical protein